MGVEARVDSVVVSRRVWRLERMADSTREKGRYLFGLSGETEVEDVLGGGRGCVVPLAWGVG